MRTLRFLTAGESHGPALTAILEGLPAGLPLAAADINRDLARRQKRAGAGERMAIETDQVAIQSGVLEGRTTGAPLTLTILNRDHAAWRGRAVSPYTIPRPGHVDLAAAVKYGYDDLRPALERASARETAARVAVGAVCRVYLQSFGISVGGYVVALGGIRAEVKKTLIERRIARALASDFSCPDPDAEPAMRAAIQTASDGGYTLGGVVEAVALGVPAGLGSHVQWDRRLTARLGAACLSLNAAKGVEIGDGFALTALNGAQAQDAILAAEDGRLTRPTNHCGGLEGGITNGQPIIVRVGFKPIATTHQPQPSVDLAAGVAAHTIYERSDTCPIPRAVPMVESLLAFTLADALQEKLGGDSLTEQQARCAALRQPRLDELRLSGQPHRFWPE